MRLFLASFSFLSLACIIPLAASNQSFVVHPDNTMLNISANTHFILTPSFIFCTNNVRVILNVFNDYADNLTNNPNPGKASFKQPVKR